MKRSPEKQAIIIINSDNETFTSIIPKNYGEVELIIDTNNHAFDILSPDIITDSDLQLEKENDDDSYSQLPNAG